MAKIGDAARGASGGAFPLTTASPAVPGRLGATLNKVPEVTVYFWIIEPETNGQVNGIIRGRPGSPGMIVLLLPN
ncbi:MAG: hypothetical protein QOE51_4006 [Actinoplanes sp.]|nr:hypothetical protein [Actinoplanes sp.]